MDVHCFLFTDMLLVCKPVRRDGRYKVLRQPYLVERLVVQELNREPATLAVVYLSEYRVPCNAFLLLSSDNKALKVSENIIKTIQHVKNMFKYIQIRSKHRCATTYLLQYTFYRTGRATSRRHKNCMRARNRRRRPAVTPC